MKEVILHIGLHKTGSTSIQNALKGYNKNGVKSVAFEEVNHSIPMYTIFSEKRYNYHIWQKAELTKIDIDKKKDVYLNILKEELKSKKFETLIISGEDLSVLNNNEVQALSELFNAHQVSTTVICYVRNPLSGVVSSAQELVKNGRSVTSIDKLYKSRLEKYIMYFGKQNIKVFDYQKASESEKSIVRHFSKILSIDLRDTPRLNKSLTPLQFSLIQNLNKLNLHKTRHRARDVIVMNIMKIDSELTSKSIEKLDEQYFIKLIPKCYVEDCNWLHKEFGILFKINKSTEDKNLDDYIKMNLSNSLEEIDNLFSEIGLGYDPILSLQDNFLNAYILLKQE